jgi:hypothetical protein
MVGGNIYRSNTSVSQSLAGRNRTGGGKMPTLMIMSRRISKWSEWVWVAFFLAFFFCICHNFVPDLSQCNTVNKLLCFFHCVTGWKFCMISGFCHEVNEKCTLLGYYVVGSGNSRLTFQDNFWSHLQGSRSEYLDSWPLNNGLTGCPKTHCIVAQKSSVLRLKILDSTKESSIHPHTPFHFLKINITGTC